jgi:hypothetical protein
MTGNIVNDSGTYPLVGTRTGCVLEQEGINRDINSYNFTGTSYITVADSDNLSFINNIFSFSFWMKANDTNGLIGILQKRGYEYSIHANSSSVLNFYAWTNGGSIVYNQAMSYTTNFDHYVWTADGAFSKLYRNSVFIGTSSKTAVSMSNSAIVFEIGKGGDSSGTRYMGGYLSDVRIYDYALSAEEVKNIYNLGKGTLLT